MPIFGRSFSPLLGAALIAVFSGSPALAQRKPYENPEVLTTMRLAGHGVTNSMILRVAIIGHWDWNANQGSYTYLGTWNSQTTTGWTQSDPAYMLIKPNVTYHVG